MAEVLRMFGSPVLFFREVANSEIVWFRAILPVALHVAGVSVSSSVVVAGQVEGAVIVIAIMLSVVSTFIGLLVVFWCYVGVVILFDLLFSFSREYRKLIECIALAHWPIAIWSCVAAVAIAGWFLFGDIPVDLMRSRAFLTGQGIGLTVSICVCALCGAVARAVSGVSVVVSTLLAVFLAGAFVLGPWALDFS